MSKYQATYAMFYRHPDGWGQFALMGEREAMDTWLRAKPGYVKAISCDDNHEATWEDYRK